MVFAWAQHGRWFDGHVPGSNYCPCLPPGEDRVPGYGDYLWRFSHVAVLHAILSDKRKKTVDPYLGPFNNPKFYIYFEKQGFPVWCWYYMTYWMTVALVSSLFIFYVTYWMNMAKHLDYLIAGVQLVAFICIPIIVKLSSKTGKIKAYIMGMVWWTAVILSLAFLPSTAGNIVFLIAAMAGMGIAAAHLIPWSIIPNVVDNDELRTGQRREGTFYGYIVFIQKAGPAVMLAIIPWVLSRTGFVPNQPQNVESTTAIRMMMGFIPFVLLTISMFLARKFPITREKYANIRAQLEVIKISNYEES